MRDFFRSPLFRCLICLILVCCILVNVSPIRADAFATGATLTAVVGTAAAAAVVAGAMHALGVMPDSSDTSIFEGVVNDCVSALTASGVFLNGMATVFQLSDGFVVKNHVNQGIIQAILDWLFAEKVVTESAIPLTYAAGSIFEYNFDSSSCKAKCTVDYEPFYYHFSYGDNSSSAGVVLYSGSVQGRYYTNKMISSYSATAYNGYYFYPCIGQSSDVIPEEWPEVTNIPASNILSLGHFESSDAGKYAVYDTIIGLSALSVATGLVAGQIGTEVETDYETWVDEGVISVGFGIGYVDDPNTDLDNNDDDDTGTEISPTVPPDEIVDPNNPVSPSTSPSPWWQNNKWLNIGGAVVGTGLGIYTNYLLDQTQTDVQTGVGDPQVKVDTSLFGNSGNGNNVVVNPDPPTSGPTTPIDPSDPPATEPWEPSGMGNFTLDLKKFFPFCIPFDLYAFLTCLNAEPEAPVISWQVPTPGGGAVPLEIDLSAFDSVAQLLRRLQLLVFCIGLAFKTRDLIKG